jgi:hypothetical protein
MELIGRSLCLGLCWTATYFFIRFRTEKTVFATGSVRHNCVPASRGALGLHRLCLNPPLYKGRIHDRQYVTDKSSILLIRTYCDRLVCLLCQPTPRSVYCRFHGYPITNEGLLCVALPINRMTQNDAQLLQHREIAETEKLQRPAGYTVPYSSVFTFEGTLAQSEDLTTSVFRKLGNSYCIMT